MKGLRGKSIGILSWRTAHSQIFDAGTIISWKDHDTGDTHSGEIVGYEVDEDRRTTGYLVRKYSDQPNERPWYCPIENAKRQEKRRYDP